MLPRLTATQGIDALNSGRLVLFPTETSYGLGCVALNTAAVNALVALKRRPPGKPLPVLVPSLDYLLGFGLESPLFCLASAFWPGPLTLVVPAFPGLPAMVTGETNMVGVRISAHPVAQALVSGVGLPVVATSANRSGEPSCLTAEDCDKAGLDGVEGVVPGEVVHGVGSTVVGLVGGHLHFFREGPLEEAAIRNVWQERRTF
ncbi:MAG: L-threonylcarbamoyladenylate synthase [Myxococcota bacterium]|nr:L-threonylcarbamoyladenylate synthase [Myxococcota bacterium]